MFKKICHASSRNILNILLPRPINAQRLNCRNLWCLECDRHLIGNREIVGFGIRGEPVYADHTTFPFPAIRFKELTPQIEALREKEKGDWRKLSEEERKALYRYSYCLTFAEIQAPTGQWKGVVGWLLCFIGFSIIFFTFMHDNMLGADTLPPSFNHEHVYSQMVRLIKLRMNPIYGLASQWDYDSNKWKTKSLGYENPFEVMKEYKKMRGENTEEEGEDT